MCNTPSHPVMTCTACGNRFQATADQPSAKPCPGCEAWEQLLRDLGEDQPRFLASDAILPSLNAETKRKAVYEIVSSLAKHGHLDETEAEPVTAALLHREDLASTGVGHGLAIPHATHAAVPRPIVALARSRAGIDFDSLDGKSVRVLALALCPAERPSEQLRVLARIARHLRDFDTRLRQAGCLTAG